MRKLLAEKEMICRRCGHHWQKQVWKTDRYLEIILHGYCGCGDKIQFEVGE